MCQMHPVMDSRLKGGRSLSAAFVRTACQRCRVKKLKCDSMPRQCKHCSRADVPCLIVDVASKREYARSYVDDICREIAFYEDHLRKRIQRDSPHQEAIQTPLMPHDDSLRTSELQIHIGDSESTRHIEAGSITSSVPPVVFSLMRPELKLTTKTFTRIAKLVVAAVTNKARGEYLIDFGNAVAAEQDQLDYHRSKRADYPTQEAAEALLKTYLNGPHILHPFLRRQHVTDLFLTCASGSNVPRKNLFRFFMICAIGALYLNHTGQHTAPAIDYYTAAMQYEQDALETHGLELAQNILLLILFTGQHWIGNGNKWELSRLAIRICVENDLHREPPKDIPLMQQQMRRRVFWSAYINERHASSMLGKPMAIQESDITTEIPIDADDDLIDSEQPEFQTYRGISEVAVQIRHIRIRRITAQIQAISRGYGHDFSVDKSSLYNIIGDIDAWQRSITIAIDGESTYNSREWINLNFYKEKLSCYKIMVIPPPGQRQLLHESTLEDIQVCLQTAAEIPHCYQSLPWGEWRIMNWTCVQDLLSSGFIILYCLHAIHEVYQLPNIDSDQVLHALGDDLLEKAFEPLACCNAILSQISQHWKTVRNQQRIFEILTTTTRQLLTGMNMHNGDRYLSQRLDANHNDVPQPLVRGSDVPVMYDAGLDFDYGLHEIDFDGLDWEQILSIPP